MGSLHCVLAKRKDTSRQIGIGTIGTIYLTFRSSICPSVCQGSEKNSLFQQPLQKQDETPFVPAIAAGGGHGVFLHHHSSKVSATPWNWIVLMTKGSSESLMNLHYAGWTESHWHWISKSPATTWTSRLTMGEKHSSRRGAALVTSCLHPHSAAPCGLCCVVEVNQTLTVTGDVGAAAFFGFCFHSSGVVCNSCHSICCGW